MMFSKTLEPVDYQKFGYYTYLFDSFMESKIPSIVNHFHRRWEYGMAMAYLNSIGGPEKIQSVLDVGGAGSLFPAIASLCGYCVTVVDPSPCTSIVAEQAKILDQDIKWSISEFPDDDFQDQKYDAVVSISTIEHVPDDAEFFRSMLDRAHNAVFFTTDFSMDGQRYSEDHLRTYTPNMLWQMAQAANEHGYPNQVGLDDYNNTGGFVFGYNFACMGLERA